ncbi:flavanone 7-O-glucoside 2''-O-beta-L-rhamnosyltransferase-like [Ziziphus jujuba]|uniref:Glycosyltransferase n=1 Tax=Ziziphus jujuba TaxID=326968 RepID=A0A6P3ZHQ7_ZIZJJ|nr:flavanone 7-O-glucoside 2''-O-beta-L-rhamnosyltransferase-like [Ziziphus jujuba]
MDAKQPRTSILMLPWLAYGHVSPFLELAKKLSLRKFHVYFCSTPINLKQVRDSLGNQNVYSIELVELHLPIFPQLPPHYHTTKDLPPHLMDTLKTAFDGAKPAFGEIVRTLKPNLVIYDFLQPWAPEEADYQKIKSVLFLTCGAAFSAFLTFYSFNSISEYPFQAFNFPAIERQKILQFMHGTANGIKNNERFLTCIAKSSKMVLIKTLADIEAEHIDFLSGLVGKEMVPTGPLVHEPENNENDRVVMDWLNKKDPSSVVYASFGSEYFLSKEEMEEIACGLELSKVSFIWVVRFHGDSQGKFSIYEALPEGFLMRVGDRGMVLDGWAPQAKILGHSSSGGFVSHCGWSSTLEGMINGVPIIAMPMHLDQPLNAKLVLELGVGMEVQRVNEKIKRDELARVIKEVVKQEEGKEVRRKARELSQ